MAETFRYSGHCIATRDQALCVVFNSDTTDARRYFEIKRCDVRPVAPTTATPGTLRLQRITAVGADGDTIPVAKMDSSAASLPSQVTLSLLPSVTAGSTIHGSRQMMPFSSLGLTLPATGASTGGSRGVDTSELFSAGRANSTTQGVVLREGEGLGLLSGDAQNYPHNAVYYASLTFRVVATNAVYFATFYMTPPPPGQAGFALFNASGSGVVIEVLRIDTTYVGQPTITTNIVDAPYVRFARVRGYTGGEAATPFTPDTSVSVPGQLELRKNQLWAPLVVEPDSGPAGIGAGELAYPELNQAAFRKIGLFRQALTHMLSVMAPGGTAPGVASEFRNKEPQHGLSFYGGVSTTGIRLNPQEGFALLVSNTTPYSAYYVDVELTHTPPPAGGGGGGSGAAAYPFVG